MRPNQHLTCQGFPCADVDHGGYFVPGVTVKPETISIVTIAEAAPADPRDHFYAGGEALFVQTTLQAFAEAGAKVGSVRDLLALGVYLTTAVKCGKTDYGIKAATIEACSYLLEREIALFPNVRVFLLMGDVAIKALNYIAKRSGAGRIIPAGSTYKIRGQPYFFRGARVFPSYLQAGPSFYIEKSKRRMIAEDIAAALQLAQQGA
jgi:uracil-DNA glycosylase